MNFSASVTRVFFSSIVGFTLLFTQSCNEPSVEIGSQLTTSSNARVDAKDELINRIQKLEEFANVLQIQTDHTKLLKSKPVEVKKLTTEDKENFEAKLSSSQSKEDVRQSFALINNDPDAVIDYLDKTYVGLFLLFFEVSKLGLSREDAVEYTMEALKNHFNKQNSTKGAKIDCMGACSGSLNIALDQAASGYALGMSGCIGAAFIGYGAVIFTGPFSPVAAVSVGAAELLCIGGVYFNYTSNFNSAIQSFDHCTYGCA